MVWKRRDQYGVWLPCGRGEGHRRGGEAFELRKDLRPALDEHDDLAHRRAEPLDVLHKGAPRHGPGEHPRLGFVRDHVDRAPRLQHAQVPDLGAEVGIHPLGQPAELIDPVEHGEGRVDALFWGAAVGGLPLAAQAEVGGAALARGQEIASGLAIDDPLQSRQVLLQVEGDAGAQAVRLFPHDAEEGEVLVPFGQQQAEGLHHRGQDSLGVTGAAAPKPVYLAVGREEGRHRVEVRGEENPGLAPGGQQVASAPFHGLPQHAGTKVAEEVREQGDQPGLLTGGGVYLAELERPLSDALVIGLRGCHGVHPASRWPWKIFWTGPVMRIRPVSVKARSRTPPGMTTCTRSPTRPSRRQAAAAAQLLDPEASV